MQHLSRAFSRSCAVVISHSHATARVECALREELGSPRLPAQLINSVGVFLRRTRSYSNQSHPSQSHVGFQQPSSADEEACIALYFSGIASAQDILGPTHVRDIAGKGRGLVSTRGLSPGELVMAVGPAVVLHGPQDSMPSPDALADHLAKQWRALPDRHRAALADMYTGAPTAAATSADSSSSSAPAGTSSAPAPGTQSPSSAAPAHAATDGVDVRAVVSYNAYGDEYEDLVAADLRQSSGGGGGDAAGPGVRSCVGVWPHFSSLNHACAPNCVHYVVGSTMVVRAVQAIPEGAELLISYLGRDDLAPRQVRQALLRQRYGFTCDCARCRTEAALPDEVAGLLQQLYDRARHELAPRFERLAAAAASEAEAVAAGRELEEAEGGALGDEDEEAETEQQAGAVAPSGMTAAEAAKRALRKSGASTAAWPSQLAALEPRLEECASQLHAALRELQEDDEAVEDEDGSDPAASPSAPGRALTRVQSAQAAAYQLLELLHLHAELSAASAGGGRGAAASAAAALGACWHVLDAVSRGSELQVFQACKLLQEALRQAPMQRPRAGGRAAAAASEAPEAVRDAAGLLGQSLTARYGRLRGQQLQRLTQSAMRASQGFF